MSTAYVREAAKAALAEADQRYRSLVEKYVDAIWRLDFEKPIPLDLPHAEQVELLYCNGYMGEVNLALAKHYGFESPVDAIGFRLEEFMPRDLPNSIPCLMQVVKANYQLNEFETIEQDRFGNKKIFLNNFIGEIEDGKLQRVWGTAKDITRLKEMEEEALMHSAMVGQIPEGCVITEARSEKILYANAAFTNITGYTVSDLSDEKLSVLQGVDTNPDMLVEVREAITQNRSFQGDILNYKKDGTPFWNHMRISPIKDVNGVVAHFVGILTDITEIKQNEAELHRQREELTHIARVASMGELTAALAHELNQPLTAILSNAQAALRYLQQEDPDLDDLREILNDIVADDKRAGELMHRIRRMSKRDTSKLEQLDINAVIEEARALIVNDLTIKHIRLRTELAPNLPALQGDAVQLQQVILNLVINACHAIQDMDANERLITVTTQKLDDSSVKIAIKDTGHGIDEEMQAKLFKPFCTTKDEGMGMGLAINRTIIESHGGRIWAENNPAQGATFYLTLPVAK